MIASTVLTHAREIYGDTDTTNPGVSDTILFEMLNPIVRMLWKQNPRPVSRTSTALGWTLSANTKSALITSTDILQVLGLYREAAAGDSVIGTPLRKCAPARILQLQIDESTTGTVTRYSWERAASTTEADHGKILVRFHPIPSATTHISGRFVVEPETIDAGADGIDLDDEEGYGIAKLLAWQAAPLIRQPPARVAEIKSQIPAKFLAVYQQALAMQRPASEA